MSPDIFFLYIVVVFTCSSCISQIRRRVRENQNVQCHRRKKAQNLSTRELSDIGRIDESQAK